MSRYSRILICATAVTSLFSSNPIYSAPTLPDAATPGGALPRSLESRTKIVDDSDKLIIPRVIDRPLGVNEGERVKVREFVLRGVRSHEAHIIRKEDVAFIAEANRVKRQRLDEADMEGFTREEVDDIAEFIRQLVEEPNQRPTSANLWKLVFKLRKSEWNRGLTMGQIQEVADEITRYYRQQGMILATAFIPAQDVVDGKVTIEVLEGTLGNVFTEGNEMYSDALIQRPFEALMGQPVIKDDIETGLLYLTDYPGFSVNGIFRPGKGHGESDLLVKVIDEKRFSGGVSADNNGSELTGEIRTRLDLQVNNLTGFADRLNLSVLKMFEPDNGTFGNFSYQIPVMSNDWHLGVNYSMNIFEAQIEGSPVPVEGESQIASGFIKKIFQRNRGLNSYALAELSRKNSETSLTVTEIGTDEYDVGRIEIGLDAIDTRFAGINVAILQYYRGAGSVFDAKGFEDSTLKGDFQKVNFNFSRLQTLKRNFSLLFTSQFQFTEDRLNSLEQMLLGGADSVRGFPVSEYLVDVGYFAAFEFILNAPGFADKPAFAGRQWGEVFSISAFYDFGGGWKRGEANNDVKEVHLQSAGIGMKLNLPGTFNVRFQVARVTAEDETANGIPESENDEGSNRFLIDAAYYF